MDKNKTTKIRLFGVRTCNFSVMYYCKNSLSEILTGHGISLIKRRVCQEFDNLRKFYFSQASFISLQFIFICLRYFCSCFFLYALYLSRYAPRRSEYEAFATALTLPHPYNEPHIVFWKRGKEFRARLMSARTCDCDQDN